jgi:hypothetical protein
VLETIDTQENFSKSLVRFKSDKRLRLLLTKLLDHLEKLNEDQLKILILTLWNYEGEIADEKGAMFDFDDIKTQTLRLAYQSREPSTDRVGGFTLFEIELNRETIENSSFFAFTVGF